MKKEPEKLPASEGGAERFEETAVHETRRQTGEALVTDQRIEKLLACLKEGDASSALRVRRKCDADIDFNAIPGYTEAVIKGFFHCLELGQYLSAIRIRNRFGIGIDFATLSGYTEAVQKIFLRELEWGLVNNVARIQKELGATIDFASHPGYREAAQKGFLYTLEIGRRPWALRIRKHFGAGIDFTVLPGYTEAVQKGFLECLTHSIDEAIKFRNEFGTGIDFTAQIQEGFQRCIEGGWGTSLDHHLDIQKQLGSGIDFVPPVHEAFLSCLRRGNTFKAFSIRDRFGKEIDFAALPGYREAVQEGFLASANVGKIDEALRIRREFEAEIDFAPLMSDLFANDLFVISNSLDDLRAYLLSESGLSEAPPFMGSDEVTDELLFEFEAYLAFAARRLKERVGEKLTEFDVVSGDVTALTEENQAKIQAFAANLHTELSFKIRAIASPELIAAYLGQNTGGVGSEFLTPAV